MIAADSAAARLKQYVDAVTQPGSVLDTLSFEAANDLVDLIEQQRTPAALHEALVNVLGLLVTYIGIGVSGPRSASGPLLRSVRRSPR